MTKLTALCLAILLIALQGCSHLTKKQIDQDLTSNNISTHPLCQQLLESPNWDALSDNEKDVENLWQLFNQHYKNDKKRNIAIFIDGTSNTKKSNTNVWKLYTLATTKACNGDSKVIPYYHKGVGTERFFITRTIGSITGFGVDQRIKNAYKFVVETYQPGDNIYIFGFSRGAYIARSINGFIEFAGLLKKQQLSTSQLKRYTNALYKNYHTRNNGEPKFEQWLYKHLSEKGKDFPIYRGADKVKVTAIGLFDTVPALGWSRDDYPDDHRTNLYALEGYHALAIDEQRNDFRPLRFDDRVGEHQILKEVWFAGSHANIGGGYGDEFGLESVSRHWLVEQLNKKDHRIFADAGTLDCQHTQASCEKGKLHDEFLDAHKVFGAFGIHWRKPLKYDRLHCSVIKRWNTSELPQPHEKEEPNGRYRPENLYPKDKAQFIIEEDSEFQCPEKDSRA